MDIICARHKAHLLTHPRVGGDHLVGEEVEVEARLPEDVLAELDDLQREHVLPAVVPHLDVEALDRERIVHRDALLPPVVVQPLDPALFLLSLHKM